LGALEGDTALAYVALRQNFTFETGLAADEFLAQVPAAIHPFAAGRLVSPAFETAQEAKAELVGNARKLRRRALLRENAAVVDQLQKGEAIVDNAGVDDLLREVQRRALEKLGLLS
jgi:DNA primase